jgi:DNA repair photolyase
VRWENLILDGAAPPTPQLPLGLPHAVVRTFDTPGFAGKTFYEVRAKSAINRVPVASRVPFEWTINPYRGCSHACTYCLTGDTAILMADGRTKPLAEVRVGDAIRGTVRQGSYRRYVTTEVTAHWRTVKPAHRVTLADGTELVASADHRFLTNRGWKHVTGAMSGRGRRPHLTNDNTLMGTGQFAKPPAEGHAVTTVSALRVAAIEPLGVDLPMFDITTGTGDFIANGVVSHNCFARNTHTYLDLDAGQDFDSKIVVKVNVAEVLRRELSAPKWRGDHIAMGTNVDCYQRAEGRYQLMPQIIAALRDFANPFSILTKGTLITRDLDLLRQAAEVTSVGVSFSVGFVDEALWRSVEPGTPSPRRRLAAVRQFVDAGFDVSVLMAPILPGLTDTDESIDATAAAIVSAGATSVTPIVLHLRPGAREWYAQWLTRVHPDLGARYRKLYGRGSYAPKDYQREVSARVRAAARRHGLPEKPPKEHRGIEPPAARIAAEQLTLL